MTPSFCDYPSPSIANSPSTNDSIKGENEIGSFQFFLYFLLNLTKIFNILSSYMKWLNVHLLWLIKRSVCQNWNVFYRHTFWSNLIFLLTTEHWHAIVIMRNSQLWNSLLRLCLFKLDFCWYSNNHAASDIKHDAWQCF